MKTLVPKDFKPTDRDYELIWNKDCIPREWADHQTTEWREYWIDRGDKMHSWRTTWRNNIYKLWLKVDKSRMYRVDRRTIRKVHKAPKPPDHKAITALSIERFNRQCEIFNK